ncbi:hypothetical protein [Arthrobacter sp. RIT-PI-e]|uniref:hypothetical protein n=1 Tax=Arthrobacter sp. RIT-PI-e TaxID=1681197 RepID=UPI000A7D1B74|nr:hypothetical protein [Arthrobacter sp. RIT-PI-e]
MPRGRLAVLLDTLVFARPYQRIERALGAFGALLLPASCVVCGAWDTSLCPACLAAFRRATVRPFRAEEGAESLPDVLLPTPQVAGAAGAGQACSGGPPGGGPGPREAPPRRPRPGPGWRPGAPTEPSPPSCWPSRTPGTRTSRHRWLPHWRGGRTRRCPRSRPAEGRPAVPVRRPS